MVVLSSQLVMATHHFVGYYVNRIMRKSAFLTCENKGLAADQHLCFCYIDSTIPLLPKSEISSLLQPFSVVVHPGLCCTWSETLKTAFLMTWLICYLFYFQALVLEQEHLQPLLQVSVMCQKKRSGASCSKSC